MYIYTTFKLSVSPWRAGGRDENIADCFIEYRPEKRGNWWVWPGEISGRGLDRKFSTYLSVLVGVHYILLD